MSEMCTKHTKHGSFVKHLLQIKRKDENVLKFIFVSFPLSLLILFFVFCECLYVFTIYTKSHPETSGMGKLLSHV